MIMASSLAALATRSCRLQSVKLNSCGGCRLLLSNAPPTGIFKDALREISRRSMASGARKIDIQPSKFNWTRFKNDLHFYVMLGVIPLGSAVFYSNFIIGQAELAEIPEGYEPEPYEYYKHPIHRWLMRNVYDDPIKQYEMALCQFVSTFETARIRARNVRVRQVMAEADDYRAWYFVPAVDPRPTKQVKEIEDFHQDNRIGGR